MQSIIVAGFTHPNRKLNPSSSSFPNFSVDTATQERRKEAKVKRRITNAIGEKVIRAFVYLRIYLL